MRKFLTKCSAHGAITELIGVPVALILFSGCLLLNDVNQVTSFDYSRKEPKPGRSLVVYGIGIEGKGPWSNHGFGVALDEYDIQEQGITGNCWRFNRMIASIVGIVGTRQYFMFDVQPGHYVYSGFNGPHHRQTWVFEVPLGRVVYLGDFVLAEDGNVDLQRDRDGVASYFKGETVLASTTTVSQLRLFLCAP
jgi:hypothetical protein